MNTIVNTVHNSMVFKRRTRVLARGLCRPLAGISEILDVGCGDGTIDTLIGASMPGISLRGIDVLVRPDAKIPVEPFDGKTLPLADRSVDAVMFIDVLHHTEDPMILLREATRVARNLVLIKDHTMDGPFAYATLRFMDWVGNAHHGVALPYNYWPERRWRDAFTELHLTITHWETRLGLYQFPANLVFERGLHFIAALKPGRG
jgi:SAM-dependent methyltransferase